MSTHSGVGLGVFRTVKEYSTGSRSGKPREYQIDLSLIEAISCEIITYWKRLGHSNTSLLFG